MNETHFPPQSFWLSPPVPHPHPPRIVPTQEIVLHNTNMYGKYLFMGIFDGFLVKYGAVMLGEN